MPVAAPRGKRGGVSTSSAVSLGQPNCPWRGDDELGIEEGSHDVSASTNEAEEGLRELARRVRSGETSVTSSSGNLFPRDNRGDCRKETRVSELVSIIEIVDDDEGTNDDSAGDHVCGDEGRDELHETGDAVTSIQDALLLVARYAVYMPESDAPRELLDALSDTTRTSVEELVTMVLPAVLTRLHDVLVAHVEFEQAQVSSATLESYCGPSDWDRCLRCMELSWLVKHMPENTLDEGGMMVLLHAVALGSKDVSYQVRNQTLECVDALIGVLRRFGRVRASVARAISDIVKESVLANDDRCWSAAYGCVGHLIRALAGDNEGLDTERLENGNPPGKEERKVVDELFEHVMSLAQRNRHSLVYASVWLDTVGTELKVMGIELMHYRPVLLPMLVDWAKALHADVRLGALRCVLVYLQACWPRNRAVGEMLARDLKEIGDMGCADVACLDVLEEIWSVLAATGGPRGPGGVLSQVNRHSE